MKILINLAVWVWIISGGISVVYASTSVIAEDFSQPVPAVGTGEEWMDSVTLTVPEHFAILDLDVYLDITHSDVSDLLIYLDGPGGESVWLKDYQLYDLRFQDDYPAMPNMHGTIFSDEATLKMNEGSPPYDGFFLPAQRQALDVFDGLDAHGTWTLRIFDLAYANVGTLGRWELRFETTISPEPLSLVYLILPVICGRLRNKTIRSS
jgi:subtilisin-like proprotein convertase family protein